MKIEQFKVLKALVAADFNLSRASRHLDISQPQISRIVQQFEQLCKNKIFTRSGRSITGLTTVGQQIMRESDLIDGHWANIQTIIADSSHQGQQRLRIATTHTLARFVLPAVVQEFREQWPNVMISLHQGTPEQMADLLQQGQVDIALFAEGVSAFNNLTVLPCYHWRRAILVPADHALAQYPSVSIRTLHGQPLVTYSFSVVAEGAMHKVFHDRGVKPEVSVVATDADVIKTYVRLGFGIGIVADLAYIKDQDSDLACIDCPEMPLGTIRLAISNKKYLSAFVFDFIALYCPELTRTKIDALSVLGTKGVIDFEQQLQIVEPEWRSGE